MNLSTWIFTWKNLWRCLKIEDFHQKTGWKITFFHQDFGPHDTQWFPDLVDQSPGLFGRWKPVLRWMWINVWEWYNTFRWARFISWEVFGIAAANLFVYFAYPQNQGNTRRKPNSFLEVIVNYKHIINLYGKTRPAVLNRKADLDFQNIYTATSKTKSEFTPQKWWQRKTRNTFRSRNGLPIFPLDIGFFFFGPEVLDHVQTVLGF